MREGESEWENEEGSKGAGNSFYGKQHQSFISVPLPFILQGSYAHTYMYTAHMHIHTCTRPIYTYIHVHGPYTHTFMYMAHIHIHTCIQPIYTYIHVNLDFNCYRTLIIITSTCTDGCNFFIAVDGVI